MKRILISRTDSIGDVILTLPMAGILREIYPQTEICFLGRSYTEAIISHCTHITRFLNWDELSAENDPFTKCDIDAIIHVFPDRKIASRAKQAGVKLRIGTSHRIFHWFTCNQRVSFSRKNSPLHESQLNLKLLTPFGYKEIPELSTLTNLAGWSGSGADKPDILPVNDKFNLIIHMKSRGSALEWPLHKYLSVMEAVMETCNIILTGTKEEGALVDQILPDIRKHAAVTDTFGRLSLNDLIDLIGTSDGLLACSTGPLHIAGISGINTLGLYPDQRPMDAGRWRPLGTKSTFLAGTADSEGYLNISSDAVIEVINSWIGSRVI